MKWVAWCTPENRDGLWEQKLDWSRHWFNQATSLSADGEENEKLRNSFNYPDAIFRKRSHKKIATSNGKKNLDNDRKNQLAGKRKGKHIFTYQNEFRIWEKSLKWNIQFQIFHFLSEKSVFLSVVKVIYVCPLKNTFEPWQLTFEP